MIRRRMQALAIGSTLAAASIVSAQSETVVVDRVDVRLVHLDVLVKGRDSRPVYGLVAEDFLLDVDGEPVELGFFSPPMAPDPGPQLPDTPTPTETVERADAPAELGDWFLYFDDSAMQPGSRERVRRNLLELFADWQEGPQIHVVYRRGAASKRLGPFRRPADAVGVLEKEKRALAKAVSERWGALLQDLSDVENGCRAVRELSCSAACLSRKTEAVRRYVAVQVERVERTLGDLADMISTFDPRARRSTLVYVGDGLEVIPGRVAFQLLGDLCPPAASGMWSLSLENRRESLFAQVGALANAQRVTLHMLDAGGIRQEGSDVGASFPVPFRTETERFLSLQSGFLDLAKATGGSAILNAPLPAEPLRQAAVDQLARYELGFTLNTPPDGRLLSLRLRLRDDKGVQSVSYRRSFLDLLPKDRLMQRLRGALDPAAERASTALQLTAGKGERLDRRRRKLPLTIAWPEDQVVLVPREGGPVGNLLMALLTAGPRGGLTGPRELPLIVGAGGLQAREGRYEITVGLPLAKGQHRIAVALWDQVSGEQWLQTLEVDLK